MESKMNDQTHKVFFAKYSTYQYWAVPKDWNVEDCSLNYDTLTHKGGDEAIGVFQEEIDYNEPDEIKESDLELSDYSMYFSCDEDDDEEDEDDDGN